MTWPLENTALPSSDILESSSAVRLLVPADGTGKRAKTLSNKEQLPRAPINWHRRALVMAVERTRARQAAAGAAAFPGPAFPPSPRQRPSLLHTEPLFPRRRSPGAASALAAGKAVRRLGAEAGGGAGAARSSLRRARAEARRAQARLRRRGCHGGGGGEPGSGGGSRGGRRERGLWRAGPAALGGGRRCAGPGGR